MKEIWKDVVGYEGIYEVSNYGKVKNVYWDYGKARLGSIMKQTVRPDGRLFLNLTHPDRGDRRQDTHLAHRLVAAAFLGPCPEGKQVNHKDGNPQNNWVGNLEYMTHPENVQHAFLNGLITPPPKREYKLSVQDVGSIKNLYKTGKYTQRTLASMFGAASNKMIWQVVHDCYWGKR